MEYLIARAERREKKAKKLLGWRLLAKKAAAKFDDAAHSYKEIAELYESQNDIEKAIEFFEKASNLFRQELSESQCYEKAAQLAAQNEQYTKAIVMYEYIATYSLNDIKLRHRVKGHLFNAGICKLCRGDDAVAMAKEYADSYPSFRGTWHCDSLKDITVSVEKRDLDEFNEAVEKYEQMIPLDPWQTMMLLRVEKKLEASMSRSRTLRRTKTLDSIDITSLGDGGKQREMCSSQPTGSRLLWSSSRVTPRPFKASDSIVTTGGDGGKQKKMPTGLERSRTTTRGMSTATGISELLRSNSSRIEARVKENYSILRHFKRWVPSSSWPKCVSSRRELP